MSSERSSLIDLLQLLRSGALSYRHLLSHDLSASSDRAVRLIYTEITEVFYEDIYIDNRIIISESSILLIDRSLAFLRSELPYTWPDPPSAPKWPWQIMLWLIASSMISVCFPNTVSIIAISLFLTLIVLTVVRSWIHQQRIERWSRRLDWSIWPFYSHTDMEQAMQQRN